MSTIHGISASVNANGCDSFAVNLVRRAVLLAGGISVCTVSSLCLFLLPWVHLCAWVVEACYPVVFPAEIALEVNDALLPRPFPFPRDNVLGMVKEID